MKNWKIGLRISLAFAVVILICAAMSFFNYTRVRQIDSIAVGVSDNTVPSVTALSSVETNLYRNLELLRQLVASTSQEERDRLDATIDANREQNTKSFKEYEAFPADGDEKNVYAKVLQDRGGYWDIIGQIRRQGRLGSADRNASVQMINTRLVPATEKLTREVQAVVDINNRGSKDGLNQVREAVSSTITGTIIGLLLAIAMASLIAFVLVRGITSPLAKTVAALVQVADGDLTVVVDVDSRDEVGQMANALNRAVERLNSTLQEVAESAANATSSSQQLAAAAEAISSGAQEQAASLEETSASLEEITAAVRQSADNANQASQLATSSKDSAEAGQQVVSRAITAMVEINGASAKISDIISTIDEIAFQTNLLAVNAAVEAARAGDEGRGFAVVASEVRSLAQRSALAAKEIKGLIQDSLKKVEAGSELVNRSGETLQGIVGSVKRVTDIVGEIAAASGEQSTGIEQVNTAMTQMDQVTQSNSAQTEELSATAQSLSEQAAHLMELVSTFTLSNSGAGLRDRQSSQPRASSPPHFVGANLVRAANANLTQSGSSSSNTVQRSTKATRSNGSAKVKPISRPSKGLTGHPTTLAPAVVSGSDASDASFEEF